MKKSFIFILLLALSLTSCGNFGEFSPEETVTESDTDSPTDYTPDTTDEGGFTVDDHSLDNVPLDAILAQMLDSVDYGFEDEYKSTEIDMKQFAETFSAEGVDISAAEDVLYYGPGEKKPDFALILARIANGTDMTELEKNIGSAAKKAAEKDGKEIDVVNSHTGRIMFILFAEKGVIGDEDMATLLGSFASVDAEKYKAESENVQS